ncbi:MAG: hypothetical protein ABSF09_07950 [Candidatus Bathyarchaeia archaeon]
MRKVTACVINSTNTSTEPNTESTSLEGGKIVTVACQNPYIIRYNCGRFAITIRIVRLAFSKFTTRNVLNFNNRNSVMESTRTGKPRKSGNNLVMMAKTRIVDANESARVLDRKVGSRQKMA